MKTIIIAEAGVNHNGDIALAKKLIDAASRANADYVKFQTFKSEHLVDSKALKARYQKINTNNNIETQFEMLKKLELTHENHIELIEYCKLKNIKFLSSAFDLESLDYLNKFDLDYFKIPSGEITNYPFLDKISSFNKPIILSTGMSNIDDISNAIDVLTKKNITISEVTVLHCNTDYPTSYKDVNLKAMCYISDYFGVKTGYSDHTLGIEVSLAAVALGANIIEKHFTLDRNMDGPDHKASLVPDELKTLVQSIRNIEEVISGSGKKEITKSESKNIVPARKSIFYNTVLSTGSKINSSDIISLRPGDGISPMLWNQIVGKTLKVNVKKFQKVSKNDFE